MRPSDPLYASQWHLHALGGLEQVWDDYTGKGVHVGIYDSGVQATHPDLANNYDAQRHVVIDGEVRAGGGNSIASGGDDGAHGTANAGLIGADDNGIGGVGVAFDVSLTSINVMDRTAPQWVDRKSQSEPHVLDPVGFFSAVRQGAERFDVVNFSLNQDPGYPPATNQHVPGSFGDRLEAAYAHLSAEGREGLGTVIVQSVSNFGTIDQGNGVSNTSRFSITVGAVSEDGFRWGQSSYGYNVLVSAPGDHLVTTQLATSPTQAAYQYDYSGTSASAPIVSGVVALMLQANEALGWRDVQNILATSAVHYGTSIGLVVRGVPIKQEREVGFWQINDARNWNGGGMHFSIDYGYGNVDAYSAVRMAEAWRYVAPSAQTSANERSVTTGVLPVDRHLSGTQAVDYAFTIDEQLSIEHLDLQVSLTHNQSLNMRLFLIAPDGRQFEVYDASIQGPQGIATTPWTWTFGLDNLRGEMLAGTWTVRMQNTDEYAGPDNVSSLESVALTAYGTTPSADDVYHYTDEFLLMAEREGERRTLVDANGGTDWIQAAAMRGNLTLDLRQGATSWQEGNPKSTQDRDALFVIGDGTVIENAIAGDGNDHLIGNESANHLLGMRGDDTLDGGAGDDILQGGPGNNLLTGGAGADTFVFTAADGARDVITDFGSGDRLRFTDLTLTGFSNGEDGALGQGELTLSFAQGVTTLAVGVDERAGADLHLTLNGQYGVDDFVVEGGELLFHSAPPAPDEAQDQRGPFVAHLYDILFGRAADSAGARFWTELMQEGASAFEVAGQFLRSAEYALAHVAPLSDSAFVESLYQGALQRSAFDGAAGPAFWSQQLGAGHSRAEVVVGIIGALDTPIAESLSVW